MAFFDNLRRSLTLSVHRMALVSTVATGLSEASMEKASAAQDTADALGNSYNNTNLTATQILEKYPDMDASTVERMEAQLDMDPYLKNVVQIVVRPPGGEMSIGSGVFVDGKIVTAAHVVDDVVTRGADGTMTTNQPVSIFNFDGQEIGTGAVRYMNQDYISGVSTTREERAAVDHAVLDFTARSGVETPRGLSLESCILEKSSAACDDKAYVMGFPMGVRTAFEAHLTHKGTGYDDMTLDTEFPFMDGGLSGGAVITAEGKLLGLAVQIPSKKFVSYRNAVAHASNIANKENKPMADVPIAMDHLAAEAEEHGFGATVLGNGSTIYRAQADDPLRVTPIESVAPALYNNWKNVKYLERDIQIDNDYGLERLDFNRS